MGCLKGSGVSVLYIGRTFPEGNHDEEWRKLPRKATSRNGRTFFLKWYRRWTRCINCKGDNIEV